MALRVLSFSCKQPTLVLFSGPSYFRVWLDHRLVLRLLTDALALQIKALNLNCLKPGSTSDHTWKRYPLFYFTCMNRCRCSMNLQAAFYRLGIHFRKTALESRIARRFCPHK